MADRYQKYITPFGVVKGFAAIDKPSTKFDDDGIYSFNLEFAGKDAKEMKAEIDHWMGDSLEESGAKKAANPPYEINKDDKTLIVKFKLKAVIISRSGGRYEKTIDLYGANGGKIRKPKRYAEGSVLRASYTVYMWNAGASGAGITLQPVAVQFKKVVEWESTERPEFDAVDGYDEASDFQSVDGQNEPAPQIDNGDTDGDDFDF